MVSSTNSFLPAPTAIAAIGAPAQTILATDSVWSRDASGTPYGGGNNAIDPPCRLYADGTDSFPSQKSYLGFYWFSAWNPTQPLAWNVFGGVWSWHSNMITTAFADGHVKALTIGAISAGCNVKAAWGGPITDKDAYLWDLK